MLPLQADVARLYRICLLRRLGLSLDDIARALDDPQWSLRAVMAAHVAELDPPHRGGHPAAGPADPARGPGGGCGGPPHR